MLQFALKQKAVSVEIMAEECVLCDAKFDTRAELEKHVAEAHTMARGTKLKL